MGYISKTSMTATLLKILLFLFILWSSALGSTQKCSTVYIPGKYLLGFLVPIHHKTSHLVQCEDHVRSSQSVLLTEAAIYAVNKFNNRTGPFKDHYLSGKIGLIGFDTCYNPIRTSHKLTAFHTGTRTFTDCGRQKIDPEKVIGYVTDFLTSVNLGIVDITKSLNLIQISYGATSLRLYEHPNILSTMPATDVENQAIIEYVKAQGWNSISILYRNDAWGIIGHQNLMHYAKQAGICVSILKSIPVKVAVDNPELQTALRELMQKEKTRAVILILGWQEAISVLTAVSNSHFKKHFTWIGSQSMGDRPEFTKRSFVGKQEAEGSVTIMADVKHNKQLRQYIINIDPRNHTVNPFFKEFFELKNECKLSHNGTTPQTCQVFNMKKVYTPEPLENFVIRAVHALIIAVSNVMEILKCPNMSRERCSQLRSKEAVNMIVAEAKKVKLSVDDSQVPSQIFSSRGDGLARLKYNNIQKKEETSLSHFVQVKY